MSIDHKFNLKIKVLFITLYFPFITKKSTLIYSQFLYSPLSSIPGPSIEQILNQ